MPGSRECRCCNMRPMLAIYWLLDIIYFLYYVAGMIAIMVDTDTVLGAPHQIAFSFSAFHFVLFGVVLYAMDARARPHIALGFMIPLATDLTGTLFAAIHLSHVPDFRWAYYINLSISIYGLCISVYALLWYFTHLYRKLGSTSSTNKYERYNP
jgi:hypothetical protein